MHFLEWPLRRKGLHLIMIFLYLNYFVLLTIFSGTPINPVATIDRFLAVPRAVQTHLVGSRAVTFPFPVGRVIVAYRVASGLATVVNVKGKGGPTSPGTPIAIH